MNIQNVTITGPAAGFQLCTNSNFVLYGIFFNAAGGGSVTNVTVDHIFQFQNGAFGSCQTGRAIRADDSGTVTITNTVVRDYQKSGFEPRSLGAQMTMNLSGSIAGPPHALPGFIAQNAVSYVGAAGTIAGNEIIGAGDQYPDGPDGGPGPMVQIIVPTATKGVDIVRGIGIWGRKTSDHCEVKYVEVRVPLANALGAVGEGHQAAQDRLGAGRVYHCMNSVGQMWRAFDLMVERARSEGVELTGDNGLLTALVRQVLQTGLEVEMTDQLGYEPHAAEGRGSGNSRNGPTPRQ